MAITRDGSEADLFDHRVDGHSPSLSVGFPEVRVAQRGPRSLGRIRDAEELEWGRDLAERLPDGVGRTAEPRRALRCTFGAGRDGRAGRASARSGRGCRR